MQKKMLSLKEITDSEEVKQAMRGLTGVAKPPVDLQEKLNAVAELYRKNATGLEKYMSFYTAWQNYLGEQMIIADVIRTVAQSQAEYYYACVMRDAEGTVTDKKQSAASNQEYRRAYRIAAQAEAYYNSLIMQFQNCDRAFKLSSRIITSRLGLKET
jgi:hypothetical protein